MKVELGRGERAFLIVLFAAIAVHLRAHVLPAYPAMPQTVPTHWGADGAVDGWGDKAGTLFTAAMPLVLALAMLRVKYNYTFCIRMPWTLVSEDNWHSTRYFAGSVFVVARGDVRRRTALGRGTRGVVLGRHGSGPARDPRRGHLQPPRLAARGPLGGHREEGRNG